MTIVAILIFVLTLTLVIWQPKGLGIGWSALGGAILALVAIVLISLILDESGFFEWAALHVARWGRGNGRLLFVLIVLLGAVIAAVFANDGAALILTPIVIQMLLALKFPPTAALGFVMATGFIADAGSLPLVVSNLVNIVSADYFDISFARYALVMVPVGIVTVLASLAVLFLYFRKTIPARYDVSDLPAPASAVTDVVTFRAGWIVLALLLIGYFSADPLGIPLSVIAGSAAIVLILVAARQPRFLFRRVVADAERSALAAEAGVTVQKRISVGTVVKNAPWQIVLFSIGMYLVVYGLRNQGLTDELAKVFGSFNDQGVLVAALGTGIVVAVLASMMNNMPTVLIAALAIGAVGASGLTHEAMVYANIIGSDLGPKITPIGSLATLLWLHVLDKKGIHIGWGQYFRTGIVLTIPVLLISLVTLAGWLMVVGV
jgi:arsenical pump membrane protein